MGQEQKVKANIAQTASSSDRSTREELGVRNLGEVAVETIELGDLAGQAPVSESNVRVAALRVQILDLESQLAALSEAVANEKGKALALEANAARLSAIEAELSAASSARDAAGSVASAAVAELRELRLVRNALLREREVACFDRDAARAAARAAEARVLELEALCKRGDCLGGKHNAGLSRGS